jgi:hypothetical protein
MEPPMNAPFVAPTLLADGEEMFRYVEDGEPWAPCCSCGDEAEGTHGGRYWCLWCFNDPEIVQPVTLKITMPAADLVLARDGSVPPDGFRRGDLVTLRTTKQPPLMRWAACPPGQPWRLE